MFVPPSGPVVRQRENRESIGSPSSPSLPSKHAPHAWLPCPWPDCWACAQGLYAPSTQRAFLLLPPPKLRSLLCGTCPAILWLRSPLERGHIRFRPLLFLHGWHVRGPIVYQADRVHIGRVAETRSVPSSLRTPFRNTEPRSYPPPSIAVYGRAHPPPLLSAPLSIWLRPGHQALSPGQGLFLFRTSLVAFDESGSLSSLPGSSGQSTVSHGPKDGSPGQAG